jgi:Baseplate J-like protein
LSSYVCCRDDVRKNEVRDASVPFNGIDFLEVVDDGTQLNLKVHFLKPVALALDRQNVRIEGGERVIDPEVLTTSLSGDVLAVQVAEPGDFTPYTLRLVAGTLSDDPPAGIDPLLAAVRFTFKVNCPSDFDCRVERVCPPELAEPPQIDYLAKDYSSFRRLMLDRLEALVPRWRSREAADVGVALVELLAYVGDQLSYFQDAVATEAYLGTARRRVSVRRHARLVDYRMHDGCNARVWVQVQLPQEDLGAPDPGIVLERGARLLTALPGMPPVLDESAYRLALGSHPEVFETLHDLRLFRANQDLRFYAWGARDCCLPAGSTTATLRGRPQLQPGDVLVLAERLGAETGSPADADPARRQAVLLTEVTPATDEIGGRFDDPPTSDPVDVTEISWHVDDALRLPLCVSAETDTGYRGDVAHALGNIVLADHGRTVKAEEQLPENRVEQLGVVPEPSLFRPAVGGRCAERVRSPVAPRFRPSPAESPVTQAASYDPERPPRSAAAATATRADEAMPAIRLLGTAPGALAPLGWEPARDLLEAGPTTREFVVEVETDGTSFLRFGDDIFGLRPASGTAFAAVYRVGNGTAGNVGAQALAHIVRDSPSPITGVTNPLPATGGVDPQSAERVRQSAPSAFRTQLRAVTLGDYGEVTERHDGVQRAAASLRWTGSWRTVIVTVDRLDGRPVDGPFRDEVARYLDGYRMAGQDIDVDGPRFASLDVELHICVNDDYFRSDVERQLLDVFSSGALPDGRRGFFHPDNFTFGQPVWLSRIYAAAQGVPGVDSVEVTRLQRQGNDASDARDSGVLRLSRLEVARIEQNPDFPEHGVLAIELGGGK